jgi:hypothetical protein
MRDRLRVWLAERNLQDIEAWIEIVKKKRWWNTLLCLRYFPDKHEEWLKDLEFLKKQELEKIKYFSS